MSERKGKGDDDDGGEKMEKDIFMITVGFIVGFCILILILNI